VLVIKLMKIPNFDS